MSLDHHRVLTSPTFTAPAWPGYFDSVIQLGAEPVADYTRGATLIWLCTAVKDWRQVLQDIQSTGSAGVVVMAMAPTPQEAREAFALGARAYIHALAGAPLLDQVTTAVQAGGYWLPETMMLQMIGTFDGLLSGTPDSHTDIATDELDRLTPREREVCQEVKSGNANKVIARNLGITERTVKEHLSRVFSKLGIRDRVQLMLYMNGKLELAESVTGGD